MVLFLQLEPWIGRTNVVAAIASFLAEPAIKSVEDLRGELEQVSGMDLGAYFDAWVFGSGMPSWPQFEVATMQQGDQVTVSASIADGLARGCVLEVDVHGANSSATAVIDFGPDPQAATAQTIVTLDEPVVSYEIDPRHKVVDDLATAVRNPVDIHIF